MQVSSTNDVIRKNPANSDRWQDLTQTSDAAKETRVIRLAKRNAVLRTEHRAFHVVLLSGQTARHSFKLSTFLFSLGNNCVNGKKYLTQGCHP